MRKKQLTIAQIEHRVNAMEAIGLDCCDVNGGYIPLTDIYIDLSETNLESREDMLYTIGHELLRLGRIQGANIIRDNLKDLLT